MSQNGRRRIAVVGGGIAGLTAATCAARAGAAVTLFESVSRPGGRARTRQEEGFRFNMGPHALYRKGPAEAVLEGLGVQPAGSPPDISRALGIAAGRLHALPGGPLSLVTTTLLGARDKWTLARQLTAITKLDPTPWNGRTLRDFLEATFASAALRDLLAALVRLSSYCHAPDAMSAGAAIAQLQSALGNGVRYLDGGWQAMVDALVARAGEAGVELRSGARVRAVEDGTGVVLRLADDTRFEADGAVLALGPAEASALVSGGAHPQLAEWAERSQPVRAACLDVALRSLPEPRRPIALGIDTPTYLSLHSGAARGLAPEGGAVFQLARYLAPDEKPERDAVQAQLEAQLDGLQPGWRERLVGKKLLLDVRVANAMPSAERGGLAGRPPVDALAASKPGLWLAGDWIGPEGWLVDGSFASGRDAGQAAARA